MRWARMLSMYHWCARTLHTQSMHSTLAAEEAQINSFPITQSDAHNNVHASGDNFH